VTQLANRHSVKDVASRCVTDDLDEFGEFLAGHRFHCAQGVVVISGIVITFWDMLTTLGIDVEVNTDTPLAGFAKACEFEGDCVDTDLGEARGRYEVDGSLVVFPLMTERAVWGWFAADVGSGGAELKLLLP